MPRRAQRYVAFLRGVSPLNAKMPELTRAFVAAGFEDVKTVLGSGNVVFSAAPARAGILASRAEAAMQSELGASFLTIVRAVDELRELLASEPFSTFRLPRGSKRVVTFLAERPRVALTLPLVVGRARIWAVRGQLVLSSYVLSEQAPTFMSLIERSFGKRITTRTWETIMKCAK